MVEGLLKTVDILEESISGGEADLILLNACCKERIKKVCGFQDGMQFPCLL
jgi:hypothetical protein